MLAVQPEFPPEGSAGRQACWSGTGRITPDDEMCTANAHAWLEDLAIAEQTWFARGQLFYDNLRGTGPLRFTKGTRGRPSALE